MHVSLVGPEAYRSDLLTELGIDEPQAAQWEHPPDLNSETIQALANSRR